MKVKKFYEQIKSRRRFHVFSDFSYEDGILPDFYIFENDEDAFNYLANRLYKIYDENGLNLDILDKCEDVVELIERYEEDVHENGNIDNQLIYYTPTDISNDIDLDDWIQIRRKAKKYNL